MSIALIISLMGCVADVVVDVDADADGLLGSEEAEIGTDPNEADSDGDGVVDGDELSGNTDPLDASEYPYLGGWDIGSCKGDIEGESFAEGDVSTDWGMMDQFGQTVSLHSFCDKTIYLVFAAFW